MVKTILCDIDGTLADVTHRRHFLDNGDWKSFFEAMVDDPCILPVAEILEGMHRFDYEIILCSGRPEDYREQTENWLRENGIWYDELHMRPSGDFRSDVIIKREMLHSFRKRDLDIFFVLDDRRSVVDFWRSEGLICLQCAPGDFDKPKYKPGMLTMMVGPSGAGKTTWLTIAEPEQIVSSDKIRETLCEDFKDQSKNKQVFAALHAIVKTRIEHGLHTIVDATNLRNKDRRAIRDLVPDDCKIEYIVIDRPLKDKLRDGGWRLGVNIKGKNLIEYHHDIFQSNLKAIMAGDDDPRVTVLDRREV